MALDPVDHVSHLRLTHFTLVLVSLTVIAASWIARPAEIELALGQLRAITDRVADLSRPREVLERFAWSQNQNPVPPAYEVRFQCGSDERRLVLRTLVDCEGSLVDYPQYDPHGPRSMHRGDQYPKKQVYGSLDHQPQTLADFIQLWNACGVATAYHIELPQDRNEVFVWLRRIALDQPVARIEQLQSLLQCEPTKILPLDSETVHQAIDLTLRIEPASATRTSDRDANEAPLVCWPATLKSSCNLQCRWEAVTPYSAGTGIGTVAMDVTCGQQSISGRLALQPTGVSWGSRDFEEAFRDLSAFTRVSRRLDFAGVRELLEDEKQRAGDFIEVLGAKLPQSSLHIWGPLVIVLIQFYFLLHFGALQWSVIRSAGIPAWFGLYEGKLPLLVAIGSSSVLPTVACLFVVFSLGLESVSSAVCGLLMCGVSLIISVAVLRKWLARGRHAELSVPDVSTVAPCGSTRGGRGR